MRLDGVRRVIAQVKATDPTSWRLDKKNSQEDQAFHRSEMNMYMGISDVGKATLSESAV